MELGAVRPAAMRAFRRGASASLTLLRSVPSRPMTRTLGVRAAANAVVGTVRAAAAVAVPMSRARREMPDVVRDMRSSGGVGERAWSNTPDSIGVLDQTRYL